MSFQGKTALITGGTSGMGIATARAMAEKGASVIITGRDETRGASTVEKIRAGGHDAQFIAADFSEMSEVRRIADAADEIDVLVNAAGFAARGLTADTDEAAFDGLFQINVKAPFFLVAALAPKIAARGGGSIINVSTMVAGYGQLGMAAYGASRAAVELLTQAWAPEYGPQNVRVNAVAPGPTLTPSVEPRLEMAKEFAKTLPLGRVADVHELSDVITFLATRRPAISTARSSPSTAAAGRSKRRRDDPRHHSRRCPDTKPPGCSLTILLARNPDKVPGLRAGGGARSPDRRRRAAVRHQRARASGTQCGDPRTRRGRRPARPRRADSGGLSDGYDKHLGPLSTSTGTRTSFSQHSPWRT
jgi:NAD(P)-dependent dehydrogenase (short-subunit alcohol dehydrogenase family)